jgi:AcrR family transcriptional regulator
MKELILDKAGNLFFTYGLKTTTMDDVAKAACVSKKTIYQSFSSKNEMLNSVIQHLLTRHQQGLEQCKINAKDAVEEVVLSARLTLQNTALFKQNFFYDLEKSFPKEWLLIKAYRQQVLLPFIIRNLQKGIADGHYRSGLDVPFIAHVRVQQIMTAFNLAEFGGEIKQNSELLLQLSEFYLYGIASVEGTKLINKYLNVNNETQASN